MKHILIKFSFLVILSILLVACSEKEDNETIESDTSVTEEDNSSEDTDNELPEEDDEKEPTETGDATNPDSSSQNSGDFPDNQYGLGIGDTAIVKNNFSEHEITLNSVEIKEQVGDTTSEQGNFVIVNLTVLNTGDEAVAADDIFTSTDLSTVDNSSGYPWYYIEGVAEEWPGEIEPGESQTGVLLFDMAVSDKYILNDAKFLEGLSNQISFEFTPEEAE